MKSGTFEPQGTKSPHTQKMATFAAELTALRRTSIQAYQNREPSDKAKIMCDDKMDKAPKPPLGILTACECLSTGHSDENIGGVGSFITGV
jgi:hypothetical protein